jgi:hypothetical protein
MPGHLGEAGKALRASTYTLDSHDSSFEMPKASFAS